MSSIDGRTAAMRAVAGWEQELLRDLGGDVSAQRMALVDLALRTRLYVDHIDCWLKFERGADPRAGTLRAGFQPRAARRIRVQC